MILVLRMSVGSIYSNTMDNKYKKRHKQNKINSLRGEFMSKFKDLTGQHFGKLTVLYRDQSIVESNGARRTTWCCKCECGREKTIRMDALIGNRTKSCGMCNNDLIGQKFGRLTVLYKMGTDKVGHIIWKCRCDCGNDVDVLATNLIQQYTQSCGCMHSEVCSERGEDLIGQKFGKLTVISLASIYPRKYLCNCECGGQAVVQSSNLKNHHTQSCGCIVSLGQEKINTYLSSHHIRFKPEYSVSIVGFKGLARYDFAVLNENNEAKILIEYHGRQHYEVANSWNDSEDDLLERQMKDKLKREWANKNNIPLYEIPYWEFDNLDIVLNGIVQQVIGINNLEEAQEEETTVQN